MSSLQQLAFYALTVVYAAQLRIMSLEYKNRCLLLDYKKSQMIGSAVMVTLSIAEQDGRINRLLKTALKKKGYRVSTKENTDADYLLLSGAVKNCDLLLLHHACPSPQPDYMTIINTDEENLTLNSLHTLTISYGLNPLATVTASSIKHENNRISFSCCLQRAIVTLKGSILEPQEFPVKLQDADIGTGLAFAALGLVLSFSQEDYLF